MPVFCTSYISSVRGQGKLYEMTINHFKIGVDPDGRKYVYQAIDEHDKNHGINEQEEANQAKMYEHPGKSKNSIAKTV